MSESAYQIVWSVTFGSSSSVNVSQSLSIPSQTSAVGDPGVQVSVSLPSIQVIAPVEPQAPTPHEVGSET